MSTYKENPNYWSNYIIGKIEKKDYKINIEISQIFGENVLLAVLGKQRGRFFLIQAGIIKEVRCFSFKKPQYSDKEGFFMSRGKNIGIYKTGAVHEPKKQKIFTEQGKILKQEIKKIVSEEKPDAIYFFVPDYIKKEIEKVLPAEIKKHVKSFINGEYFNSKPLDLIKKLKSDLDFPVVPVREESRRLMQKPKQSKKQK